MPPALQVVWINELAVPIGGAERYVAATADLLRASGVRSVLLYGAASGVGPEMARSFDGVFPMIALGRQLEALRPDLVYAHQLGDRGVVDVLAECGLPVLRFLHDHKLFCLREGKFTTLGGQTCTRTIGLGCYPCLGFARRSASWPGVRLQTVGDLRGQQDANRRLAGLVVGSEYMASHAEAHGFERSRIHVLPLWAPEPRPAPGQIHREPDLLLTAGQLIRGKGHDVLLEAMAKTTRPARLAIAGDGRLADDLRRRADTLGLGARVTFLGRIPEDELAVWYRRASALVLPTRAPETFGLVGVEAASHGTPVIASRVGAIPEWLEDGRSGRLVPPNDPDALARAIDELLGDPALARAMGERGRAIHRARYLPVHHLAGLLALFEKSARRSS